MAVVGIDLGNLASKIGVARHRGIDIITNEVSNRSTPSLVAFGPKQRAIGEAAKTQEISNYKNTVGSLKRLVGRTVTDPEVTEIEKKFINATLVDANGTVGVKVNYLGEPTVFSATQLLAMYLGKLRDIASNELKQPVSNVVIAVPGWYTDVQRRAVIDAANIATLNPLRIINDTTAVALGYGITKSDLPEPDQTPRHVVFVDIGHSNYSVSVVAFSKGQLQVKSTAHDRRLGGRDFDYALVKHFAEEFRGKYKIDVLGNAKATFRLATQVERLKKILSANTEANLSVESIMNDIDASSKLSRDKFENLVSHTLDRVVEPLQQALIEAGITPEQIDAVELVGGSTRIPAIRQRIQSVFPGKALSFTLNQDEAVARGATFTCAMLSPVFRVREFAFHDISPYSVSICWDRSQSPDEPETELEVFTRGNVVPSTKLLSFARTGPFDLEARYTDSNALPGAINSWVASFHAKAGAPESSAGLVKVKTRLNPNGLVSFEAAYVEEEVVEKDEDQQPMEVDGVPPEGGDAAAAPPKKKKRVIKKEIPFFSGTTSLEKTMLESLAEKEGQMHAADKLVMETEDRKNALEEYIYDVRGKLDDRYAAYVQPAEKEKLIASLEEAQEWLYTEEGEDATKSAYVSRLDALHALGDPIAIRWREAEERPRATSQLRETINTFLAQATSGDERYAHIDEKEKQSVVERAATVQKWLDDQIVRQAERPRNVDPVVRGEEIAKKREELVYFATPILNKPKPKPKVETPPPQANGTGTGTQTPKSGEEATPMDPEGESQANKGPPEMDVD